MKTIVKVSLISGLLIIGLIGTSKAQFSFSVRIGNPPAWAPREYAARTRYYYFPEMDCYYDAEREGYYYNNDGDWVFSTYLPQIYAGYDFYSGPKIYLDYFGGRPFDYFRDQREVYYRQYNPGGHLDFYGGFERGRGHTSGWDERWRNEGRGNGLYRDNWGIGRREQRENRGDQGNWGGDRGRNRVEQGHWWGDRGGERGNQGHGWENRVGDRGGNRGNSGGDRGGNRGGDRGNWGGDRGGNRGGDRGNWGGDRGGNRGGDHGQRGH